MGKILTVSIAGYNVEKYIEKTLKSVLVNNIDDLEILVEDDGGNDSTADIVRQYEEKYPNIVKLVHKENGGYGSTINKSIEIATGKYFKQLDGDDWYDSKDFEEFLELLRTIDTDVVYTPYYKFYEKNEEYESKDYYDKEISGEFKVEEVLNKSTHSLEMYTMTFKTELLRNNKIELLTKCLYTDKQYAMYPIIYANTIYISHLYIYVYRFGRDEQSMSVNSKRKHYKEQVVVTNTCLEKIKENMDILSDEKKKYLLDYIGLEAAAAIGAFLILLDPSREALNEIKEFENHIIESSDEACNEMCKRSKIARILKMTNYNYFIYKTISNLKLKKAQSK